MNTENPFPSRGWVKLWRSNEFEELLKTPNAFILLSVIAARAQRQLVYNRHNLNLGEAFIGDYANYGMSRKQYRTAVNVLKKGRFAAFKRANWGTVATIMDTRVFDINIDPEGHLKGHQRAITGPQPRTKEAEELLKENQGFRISRPASIEEVEDYCEKMDHDPECVSAFVDLNNAKGWRLLCHWKTALDGFAAKFETDRSGG